MRARAAPSRPAATVFGHPFWSVRGVYLRTCREHSTSWSLLFFFVCLRHPPFAWDPVIPWGKREDLTFFRSQFSIYVLVVGVGFQRRCWLCVRQASPTPTPPPFGPAPKQRNRRGRGRARNAFPRPSGFGSLLSPSAPTLAPFCVPAVAAVFAAWLTPCSCSCACSVCAASCSACLAVLCRMTEPLLVTAAKRFSRCPKQWPSWASWWCSWWCWSSGSGGREPEGDGRAEETTQQREFIWRRDEREPGRPYERCILHSGGLNSSSRGKREPENRG